MKKKFEYRNENLRAAYIYDTHIKDKDWYFMRGYPVPICDEISQLVHYNVETDKEKILYTEKDDIHCLDFEDGIFYLDGHRGNMTAVSVSGEIIWQFNTGLYCHHAKVIGDKIYKCDETKVGCVDKRMGEILWIRDFADNGTVIGPSMDKAEKFYRDITWADRQFYKLNNNSYRWCFGDETKYSGEKYIVCIDTDSNEALWDRRAENRYGFIGYKNTIIYSNYKSITIINAENGEVINMFEETKLSSSPLFVDENRIYYKEDYSCDILAYEIDDKYNFKKLFLFIPYHFDEDYVKHNFDFSMAGPIIRDNCMIFAVSKEKFGERTECWLYCIDKYTGEEISKRRKLPGICNEVRFYNDDILVSSGGRWLIYEI